MAEATNGSAATASPSRDIAFHPPSNAPPPRGPASQVQPRAPPTGPANRNFSSPAMSPPIGPSGSSAASPVSAQGRPIHNPVYSAPSRPRGGFGGYAPRGGGFRGGFGGRGGAAFGNEHSSIRSPTAVYHNPNTRPYVAPQGVQTVPLGPRSSGVPPNAPSGPRGAPTGPMGHGNPHGNGSSATYPRTQRFLADLPTLVPGGRKMQTQALPNAAKVKRLEEEAERLRKIIEDKEKEKRAVVGEWERLENESEVARLRTELAEEGLRKVETSIV
jgi:hypothetical protein